MIHCMYTSWYFLSKILCGLERPEPIRVGGSREGVEHSRHTGVNDSNPIEFSGHDTGNFDGRETYNSDIEA